MIVIHSMRIVTPTDALKIVGVGTPFFTPRTARLDEFIMIYHWVTTFENPVFGGDLVVRAGWMEIHFKMGFARSWMILLL